MSKQNKTCCPQTHWHIEAWRTRSSFLQGSSHPKPTNIHLTVILSKYFVSLDLNVWVYFQMVRNFLQVNISNNYGLSDDSNTFRMKFDNFSVNWVADMRQYIESSRYMRNCCILNHKRISNHSGSKPTIASCIAKSPAVLVMTIWKILVFLAEGSPQPATFQCLWLQIN